MPNFQPFAQSPLHHFNLGAEAVTPSAANGVWANELPLLGYIVLRGEQTDAAFANAVQQAASLKLPEPGKFTSSEAGVLLWQSPDELLLVCVKSRVPTLLAAFEHAFTGVFAQAVDNSGGLTSVYLGGKEHVTLLRHVGVYDFETIAVGDAINTVLGKATATIWRVDNDSVQLIIRRSFADYQWRLLRKAATPYRFAVGKLTAQQGHSALRLLSPAAQPKATA
jgi:sarcosine oxidase subunit gamma